MLKIADVTACHNPITRGFEPPRTPWKVTFTVKVTGSKVLTKSGQWLPKLGYLIGVLIVRESYYLGLDFGRPQIFVNPRM